jgi:hypothetical protein
VAVRGRSQWSEALHHRNRVTWSISTPRSAASSSVARYDSRYRRYRRTVTMITAGGKRNRAAPGSYSTCPSAVRERSMRVNHVCQLEVEHILGSPPWYR